MEVTLNLTKFVTLNEELSGEIFPSFLSIEEFIYLGICYNMKSDEPFCMKPPLTIDYEKLETLGFIKITQDIVYLRDRAMGLFGKQSDDILELTRKYLELFPKGIRSGGYLVRSGESGVADKLRKFLKNHKNVTHEQILEATRRFIARKRQEGWHMMKTAIYFIYKDNISVLESEIENLQQSPTEPKSNNLNKML
jgi:hypothetical protein